MPPLFMALPYSTIHTVYGLYLALLPQLRGKDDDDHSVDVLSDGKTIICTMLIPCLACSLHSFEVSFVQKKKKIEN